MGKYNNRKVFLNGHKFDSVKESERYLVLKDKPTLVLQPKFYCIVNNKLVCTYSADFAWSDSKIDVIKEEVVYWTKSNSKTVKYNSIRSDDLSSFVVEDVKSAITKIKPSYRIKKKLVEALYNFELMET